MTYLKRQGQRTESTKQMLGTSIFNPVARMVIDLDAFNLGWGPPMGSMVTAEAAHHINYLEPQAVCLSLETFTKDLIKCAILVRSDNILAVTYLGGAHSIQLCNLAIEIWEWCLTCEISLTAEHRLQDSRPGVKNDSVSFQLDAEPGHPGPIGAISSGYIYITSDIVSVTVLLLAARPRGRSYRCIHTELGSEQRLCQPSLVLINRCLYQMIQQQAMIPGSSGNVGGLLLPSP